MSDIHKCGFFGVLASLLRRAMCVGSRRGSNESCYRELDDQDARYGNVGSSDSTPSADPDKTFREVVAELTTDDVANAKNQKKPIGPFMSLKKRHGKVTRFNGEENKKLTTLLDDSYPLNVRLLLAKSTTWEFDTHDLDRATGGRCLPILCMHLFSGYGLFSIFKLLPESCLKLFQTIEDNYHASNLYHNSVHAADVTQAVHCFLQQPRLLQCLKPLEVLVVLLAAITHDLDHPGVNHSFLVATNHPLAIMFNEKDFGMNDRTPFPKRKRKTRRLQEMLIELAATRAEFSELESSPERPGASSSRMAAVKKNLDDNENQPFAKLPCESILEHHHWRIAYSCILESGVFDHMPERLPEIKRMLRSLILATDITKQDLYLNVFKDHLKHNTLDMNCPEHRHIVLQMALKTADISNPGRTWVISNKWSNKVCTEFFAQGDREIRLRLKVSNLCDRNKDTVPKIQKGFFRYVVMPLFTVWHQYLRSELSKEMIKNLVHNEAEWTRKDVRSALNSTSQISDMPIISDADNVELDLETSTNISGSSEVLFPASLGSGRSSSMARAPRRGSQSPIQHSSIKEIFRRYSAPLHIFSESRPRSRKKSSISEFLLREDLQGVSSNPLKDDKPGQTSMFEIAMAVVKSQEKARQASGQASPAPAAQEPVKTSISQRLQGFEYTLELDSDDDEASSDEKAPKTLSSMIAEEMSTSSGSQLTAAGYSNGSTNNLLQSSPSAHTSSAPSSDRRLDCLGEERTPVAKTAASSCNMITFTAEKKDIDEITEVWLPRLSISEPYHRRRGSAPAPVAVSELQRLASNLSLQLELRKRSASSCHHKMAVEGVPVGGFARRGSLPVEVMTACIST